MTALEAFLAAKAAWREAEHAGEIGGHPVTFTERPDILITAECEGLTMSWLKGDMTDEQSESQKRNAAAQLVEDVKALHGDRS